MRNVLAIVILMIVVPTVAPAQDLEAQAKRIEDLLMAPCCMTNTVAVHESGSSQQIRREIREMLAAGRTEREILDHYVEQHGPQILAMPEARGFSLTPYLFPLVFVLLGGAALVVAMRRWRRAESTDDAPRAESAPSGPWAEKLRKELDRLD